MKIGIIAPPWIQIPPPKYGGIELVVYHLVEGLVALGEEVVLFGPQECDVSCKVIPYVENDAYIGLDSSENEKMLVAELSAKYAYAMAACEGVDIIHDHTLSYPVVDIPTVHTLHGPATEGSVKRCVDLSTNRINNFVAISAKQQQLYHKINSGINFVDTVHNCVDVDRIEWKKDKEDFFLFVGRANWEKGLDLAIRVASKAGVNLVMAVKMTEDFEKQFFREEIMPWIDKYPNHLFFQFHKEIPRHMIVDLYKRAKCTLFTSQWEEPFGLVMIESMACGTPVMALNRGAAPEVIEHGKTGFIVDTEEEMIKMVKKADKLSPEDCRKRVENHFSRENMTKNYLEVYKNILGRKK